MSTPPPSPTRRLDVDGLRGLAVLLVVAFHAGVVWLQGAFVAVDVFFVLSGFFLTTALARQLIGDDGIDLRGVYARRAWRLLPAMIVVVLATLASALLLYAPIDRAAVAEHMRPVSLFASNIAFAAGGVNYFSAGENPLLHTWTLGVEWQLVLIFPALVVLLVALGHRRAGVESGQARRLIVMRTVFGGIFVVGAISFAISVWISASAPMWAYFGPHTRLWAFCAGGLMAFIAGGGQSIFGASVRATSIAQVVGFAAIFIPALLYDRSMPYPGAIALAPVGGTMLLLAGGDVANDTPFGRMLAWRPLSWIGRVSYPWYLWHWPLMVLAAELVPGIGVVGRLAWGFAGLCFAVLTQRYVERPVHERVVPRVMAGRPLLTAAAASLALVGTAQLAAMWSNNRVAHSVHRTFAAARNDRMSHDCWVGDGNVSPANKCAFGNKQSTTAIALFGDSHAEHWLGGLDRAGTEHGWRIDANVMGGCPVSDFTALLSGATARRYRGCNQFREATLARLVAQKPRAVILSSFDYYMKTAEAAGVGFQVADNVWIEGLRRTYSRLARAGIQVIVIRGTPRVPFDVPSCLSRRAAGLPFATNCTFEVDRSFIARGRRAQDVAARGLNVDFIDMNDRVCGSTRCETMRGRQVLFTDDNHLTASFTRSLGAELGERIDAALARRR
jgi:peptidoglycan/LPS O-acetylase OafA/YrhL